LLKVGQFANASSLYLALAGCSSPAPNFRAAGFQKRAATCDEMHFQSSRSVLT
jgi:hypothetical protein